MTFDIKTLQRIRMNTILGKQVYLPIVFSQYDPKRLKYSSSSENIISPNEIGYYRQFGFGICSIYKSDVLNPDINGFDRNITGWGLEDVKFLERIIQLGNKQNDFSSSNSNKYNITKLLNVFRAPDPSLIHVYHEINCDSKLDITQYNMCVGTKGNTLGNTLNLENEFLNNDNNLDYIAALNSQINNK